MRFSFFVLMVFAACFLVYFAIPVYAIGDSTDGTDSVRYWKNCFTTFVEVFRLAFSGDFDIGDLDGEDQYVSLKTGDLSNAQENRYHHYGVIGFYMFTTWVITILLLNVFIGLLSEVYTDLYAKRKQLFEEFRAQYIYKALLKRNLFNKCCKTDSGFPSWVNRSVREVLKRVQDHIFKSASGFAEAYDGCILRICGHAGILQTFGRIFGMFLGVVFIIEVGVGLGVLVGCRGDVGCKSDATWAIGLIVGILASSCLIGALILAARECKLDIRPCKTQLYWFAYNPNETKDEDTVDQEKQMEEDKFRIKQEKDQEEQEKFRVELRAMYQKKEENKQKEEDQFRADMKRALQELHGKLSVAQYIIQPPTTIQGAPVVATRQTTGTPQRTPQITHREIYNQPRQSSPQTVHRDLHNQPRQSSPQTVNRHLYNQGRQSSSVDL